MKAIRSFLRRVKKQGVRRSTVVETMAMGRAREFEAWDIGNDTFIFEKGILKQLDNHPSVLMVEKSDLRRRGVGRVLTMTTGNHSVAAFPLLDGRFWQLSRVPAARRGDVLTRHILCANVVGDTIEISQRDVPSKRLFSFDQWLLNAVGFTMNDIVMGERNDQTLEYYRRLGQEWRVKPLAWTQSEMKVALAASRKRIASKLSYYHSMKGVHFLSLTEFKRFASFAQTAPEQFVKGLKELVSIYENNTTSFTRMPKHRGHHEIEFFGVRRGLALERLVPELERLMEAIELARIGQLGVIQKANEIVALFESLLSKPAFADETTKEFAESLYMHITGEIYSVAGEGLTPAFDDRRTALPGATFENGRAIYHALADDRSKVLLLNIRMLVSKDEQVEYANVYELRGEDDDEIPIGKGSTREIVFKTNRSPVEQSKVVKRLSLAKRGYSSYVLARIEAFKALGIALSDYRILRRHVREGSRPVDYFIRSRLEGEPIDAIPPNYFCSVEDSSVEEPDVVLALAMLMGDAAAQNLAMKKYDAKTNSPFFGVGKEIYDFEYDLLIGRIVPKRVATCSIRGSFGWPDLSMNDENLHKIANFYLGYFAHALKDYQRKHPLVSLRDLADRFMEGFEFRTNAMEWQLSVLRDKFEEFNPDLPSAYGFTKKWRFVMWALERQSRRLPILRKLFMTKIASVEQEKSTPQEQNEDA